MTKAEVLGAVNKYCAYHRTNKDTIFKFNLINSVQTLGGTTVVGYGVYFNFDHKKPFYYRRSVLFCIDHKRKKTGVRIKRLKASGINIKCS
jgi:hypothetical protein